MCSLLNRMAPSKATSLTGHSNLLFSIDFLHFIFLSSTGIPLTIYSSARPNKVYFHSSYFLHIQSPSQQVLYVQRLNRAEGSGIRAPLYMV